MDQPKLERLLRIMQLMINNRRYTVKDIADRVDVSTRTIYRYIDTFRNAGFVIGEEDGFFALDKKSKQLRSISELMYFTEEEAYILKRAIESIDATNPVMDALKNKLYSVYNFKRLAEITVHPNQLNIVHNIAEAIESKRQIILKKYRSSNSGIVSDRVVEPFLFGTNMIDVVCFEPLSGLNKFFKISRIGDVETLNKEWENENRHRKANIDVFRISGFELKPIRLKMTMLAANLLIEEFPLAESQTEKISDNEYMFQTKVCSYEGIGRFVLGLCNEIEVIENNDFIDFLKRKREKSKF